MNKCKIPNCTACEDCEKWNDVSMLWQCLIDGREIDGIMSFGNNQVVLNDDMPLWEALTLLTACIHCPHNECADNGFSHNPLDIARAYLSNIISIDIDVWEANKSLDALPPHPVSRKSHKPI